MIKRQYLFLIVVLLSSAISISSSQQRPALDRDDAKAWDRMVWVTGHIHLTNHPTLGRTPANGEVIAFRRTDNNHIVAVRADIDGRYEVFLDPGRYKIIVSDLNATRTGFIDVFAAGQQKYLDVVPNPSGIVLDIDIVVPR